MTNDLKGVVVSTKMQKTVVVAVESHRSHPLYKKRMTKTKKFKVHNEDSTIKTGDTVRITQTAPISKEKSWKIVEVVK